MTDFFFVRHGVTEHTGKRLSGWMPGLHLTDEGRAQAESAAGHLADVAFEAIYSSPLERCWETAEIIAARRELQVQPADPLVEVRYGRWTDRSFRSLRRTKLWDVVQHQPSAVRFPEGETLREVQARAVDEVEKLATAHPKAKVCCVSHADVIKLVLAHYLGVHLDLFQRIVVGPASISGISVGAPHPFVWAINSRPPRPSGVGS